MPGKKKKSTVKSDESKEEEETLTINFVWSEEVKVAINRIKRQLSCPYSWSCSIPGVMNEDYDILIPDADIIYGNILKERNCWKKIEEMKKYDPCTYENVVRNFQSSVFNARQFSINGEKSSDNKDRTSKNDKKSDSDNVNNKEKDKITDKKENNKNETKIEEEGEKKIEEGPKKLFRKPYCSALVEAQTRLFPNLCLTESSLSLISLPTQVVAPKTIESETEQEKGKAKKEAKGKGKNKKQNK